MIAIDFFACQRKQIVTCSWEDACERFPCTGITMPDDSALTSMSEALTGESAFTAQPVPLSCEPFFELGERLQEALRNATVEELKDAGVRWSQLLPWSRLDINPMDLAGILLHLQSFVTVPVLRTIPFSCSDRAGCRGLETSALSPHAPIDTSLPSAHKPIFRHAARALDALGRLIAVVPAGLERFRRQ